MMRGPEGAADHTAGWLTARIPARLRVLEARYELDALPDPAYVLAHENGPLGIEDWPAVYVLPQSMRRMELVEIRADASEVYRVTYAIRVLAWVRAEDYSTTDRLRKRYVLAIREALLERKTLSPAPTYGAGDYGEGEPELAVAPETIREDYSDVFTDEDRRTIAGAWLDVDVTLIEVLTVLDLLGEPTTATGVDVVPTPLGRNATGDTVSIPPHPAL